MLYEEKILRLGQLLYNERQDKDNRIKYGSIKNEEIRTLTKEIKNYIFSKSNDFDIEYKRFKNSLKSINVYFDNIYKSNNVNGIFSDTKLTDSKEQYLNNYIYNSIVNFAYYKYKKDSKGINNIKENDVIQSIILKLYNKNKEQSKKDILKNYLSLNDKKKKFRNKYNIEQAIKNINYEMEEAQREFSKLFQDNERIY